MYLIVVTHDTIPDARITHVWAHDIVDTLPTSLSYFVPPLHIKADRKQNIEHKGLKAARHMQWTETSSIVLTAFLSAREADA